MSSDISSREDLEKVVHSFYVKLMKDELMGHFFTEAIPLDLTTHLPIIVDFWESVLLGNQLYKRNVMHKHIDLNRVEKIQAIHFTRWLELWENSIAEYFTGKLADEAIKRARMMAELMKFKIKASESGNHIY